jgi:hypothetical protein
MSELDPRATPSGDQRAIGTQRLGIRGTPSSAVFSGHEGAATKARVLLRSPHAKGARAMERFLFTLKVTGIDPAEDDFSVLGRDVGIKVLDETVFLDFSREAPSYESAVAVATREVEQIGGTVVEVVTGDLNGECTFYFSLSPEEYAQVLAAAAVEDLPPDEFVKRAVEHAVEFNERKGLLRNTVTIDSDR